MIVNLVYHSLTVPGGGERHLLETARVLSWHGWSPRIVVCGYDPEVPRLLGYDTSRVEIIDVCRETRRGNLLVTLPRGLARARRRLAHADIHLVFQGIATTWARPPEGPVKVLYSLSPPRFIHDPAIRASAPTWKKPLLAAARLLAPLDRRTVRGFQLYLANSRAVAARFERAYGVPRDAIIVVYPPVDTSRYRYEGHHGFILVVSRLERHKGVETALEVARLAREKRFVIVGDGSLRPWVEEHASRLGNVEVLGRVPEDVLLDLYARADLLLYTPLNEDFGLAPIEAAASGKPTIGVREGGLVETVEHGRTGFLLPRDPGEIHRTIMGLDRGWLEAAAPVCRMHAQKFDVKVYGERLVGVLESALRA